MAVAIHQISPVAHLPLVLGVIRKLNVAALTDTFCPPHPAHVLSCGRGVEALLLAILDGHHALYKVGARLEERGMLPLLQPGLTRTSLHDYRLGQILETLFAANLNRVFGAIALNALEVYAISTPWLHQDTTTITLYGTYKCSGLQKECPGLANSSHTQPTIIAKTKASGLTIIDAKPTMIATGLQTASRAHNHGKQPTEAIISKKKVINYFYGELDTEENLNIRRYLTGEKDRFNRRPQSAAGALYQPLDASTVGACAIPVGLLGCLQALRNDSGPVRNDSGPVRNDSGSEQGGIGNDREPKDPSVCKPKPFPLQAATYKEEARPVEGPVPPRPAYGHNKDGRDDLKQVLLSLGVNSDGLPLRLGIRDGNTSDSTETPVAIEECVALGLDGVRGIVADSKAYCKRTLGLCLEQRVGLITLVPRTCAVRPELEAWGQQHSPLPLLLEKPGRTRQEPPRRWHGHSVVRQVEVEYAEGRLALAELRFLVVHSSQLAQHAAVAYSAAQAKEGERVAEHIQRVEARWFACAADAEAAITDYEGRGQGRRGRKPRLWRFHTLHYRVEAGSFPKKRTHRGRPPKAEAPQVEVRYRLVVHTEALVPAEDAHGWTVLATTVQPEGCSDAEILQAYQEQNTTVEPGFRWIKNPAAISPVWLEKPERIAALAMLTVVGLLVYAVIQRQVRRYLCDHDRHIPGNKGPTAMPTAAVVFALFTPVMRVHFAVDTAPSFQVHGVQDYHLIVCDAVGIDQPWYQGRAAGQNSLPWTTPP